jgi:Flp pilus assembly protein TadG
MIWDYSPETGGQQPYLNRVAGRSGGKVMKKLFSDESGQVIVFTVLCLTLVLGFLAFALDVGLLLRERRLMQIAADSGALAGAAEINFSNVYAGARADAAQNGFTHGANGVSVAVNNGPANGPNAFDAAYVEVIVSQSQPTFFMKLFNFASMTVAARAVATTIPSTICLYTLAGSGPDINLTGSGSLTMPYCSIVDDSNSSNALNIASGSLIAKSIGIVGSYNSGSGSVTQTPVTGMTPVNDPLSSLAPPSYSPASCVADPNVNGSSARTIGPATPGGTVCYNGLTISGSGNTTLTPGTYVISGTISLGGTGTISGTGVTFYLAPSATGFTNGSEPLNLSAPTTGPYSGILFYQDPSMLSTATLSSSGPGTISGILYMPGATLTITGTGAATLDIDMVLRSLVVNGQATIHPYVPVSGSSPLSDARLVE